MDNLVWIIYFIDTILGNSFIIGTGEFLAASFVIIGLLFFITCIAMCKEQGDFVLVVNKFKPMTKHYLYLLGVVYALNVVGGLLPSKDTAYKMLAAYGVTEIAQNEDVQKLGAKSLEVLDKAMQDYLSEEKE